MISKSGDDVEGGKLVAALAPAALRAPDSNLGWRVVDDGTRWCLQRFDDERGWITRAGASFVQNLQNLIRRYVGDDVDAAALAAVQALPRDYRLVLVARGEYPAAPRPRAPRVPRARRLRSKKPKPNAIVIRRSAEHLPTAVAASLALAVLTEAEASKSAPARPTPPLYIRRLAAAFIAWRESHSTRA